MSFSTVTSTSSTIFPSESIISAVPTISPTFTGAFILFTFKLDLYSVTGSVFFNISVASFNKTILALSCFPLSTLTFPNDSPFVFMKNP